MCRPALKRNCELRLMGNKRVPELQLFGSVRSLRDGLLQARDFVQQLDFGGSAMGVLQNRIRDPQVFRSTEVFLQVQRLARTRQVLELTLRDRFPDAALDESAERHENIISQPLGVLDC